jgi:hypothetical protein
MAEENSDNKEDIKTGPVIQSSEVVLRNSLGRFVKGHGPRGITRRINKIAALRSAIIEFSSPAQVEKIMETLYEKALEGDIQAAKEWLNRVVGKPVQQISVTDQEGNNIQSHMDVIRSEFLRRLTQGSKYEDGSSQS